MSSFLKKYAVALGLVMSVASLTLVGCGQSPLTSDAQDPGIDYNQVSYIAFSPLAPFRAAKYNDGATPSVSKVFGPAGDAMQIDDLGNEGAGDDLMARFEVFPGGLSSGVSISMTLTKGKLSELVATFAPCGLNFNIDSELQFIVGNKLVDVDLSSIIVYHIHGDGTVEQANIWAEVTGDYTIVHVKVPGFSRYGLDP